MLRSLFYLLPVGLRFVVRRIIYLPSDLLTSSRRKKELIPPRGLWFIGAGDFVQTGDRFRDRLIEYTDLTPDSKILDIGSGIGRLARPLTKYLNQDGFYEGFDIVPSGVNWCRKNITKTYPLFHFQWIDLRNDLYRNRGALAQCFAFPYPDSHFTHAAAISVFTHLLPDETDRYLSECSRVLKPGGMLYATFFVSEHPNDAVSGFPYNFPHHFEHYALMDKRVKRANVWYQLSWIEQQAHLHGLEVIQCVKGKWQDDSGLDLQDALVIRKL